MIQCKFCGNYSDKNYYGYCQPCYQYFIREEKTTWYPSHYGEIGLVNDIHSKQCGQIVCHICGKAYTKLQSHIINFHGMTKEEYCKEFGLDKSVRLTSDAYNKKMSEYAYKYNMDEQLRIAGKNTRYKKGHKNNYERSYMTKQRLIRTGKNLANKYSIKKEVDDDA